MIQHKYNLKMAILVVSIFATQYSYADDEADKQKVTSASVAACPNADILKKVAIDSDDDGKAMAVFLTAEIHNDAIREAEAKNCLNNIGVVVSKIEVSQTFAEKIKARLYNLMIGVAAAVHKNDNLRITTPIATIGIRG